MSKKHILWADDDADDLMMMRHVLQDLEHQYNIVEVTNGREALDYLEDRKKVSDLPCLIILDMNMPVLNGKEALSIMRKDDKLKNIPVVFFTTSNSQMDKLYCKRQGVDMITKPPKYSELKSAVRRLVEYCEANTKN